MKPLTTVSRSETNQRYLAGYLPDHVIPTHLYYLNHRLYIYSLPLTMPVQFLAPQLHFIDQVFGLSNT